MKKQGRHLARATDAAVQVGLYSEVSRTTALWDAAWSLAAIADALEAMTPATATEEEE